MRKILSLLIIASIIGFLSPGYPADITSSGNGNWSSTTPDAPWPSGTVPGNGDNVTINHAVVWDIATIPASGALGTLTGTGTLTLDMDATCDSNCALNASTITAGAVAQFIILNGAADTDNAVTITASGAGGISGGATSADVTIYMNSKGVLNTDANINGGGNADAFGISINDGTFSIGGTSKTIIGGTTSSTSHAIYIGLNADGGTITGTVQGSATVGSGGVFNGDSNSTVTLVGNIINKKGFGWQGVIPTWNPKGATPDGYIQMDSDSASDVKFYSDIPSASNVLPEDTVAGETGTAAVGSGGAYAY